MIVSIISCPPESECQRCISLVRYMAQTRVVITTDTTRTQTMDMCSRCLDEWIHDWPYVSFVPLHPAGYQPGAIVQDSEVLK